MTNDELLRIIQQATKAMETYKNERLGKPAAASEQAMIANIRTASTLLLSEARSLGAAGQVCPTCSGSGRI